MQKYRAKLKQPENSELLAAHLEKVKERNKKYRIIKLHDVEYRKKLAQQKKNYIKKKSKKQNLENLLLNECYVNNNSLGKAPNHLPSAQILSEYHGRN